MANEPVIFALIGKPVKKFMRYRVHFGCSDKKEKCKYSQIKRFHFVSYFYLIDPFDFIISQFAIDPTLSRLALFNGRSPSIYPAGTNPQCGLSCLELLGVYY
jgi:hypothetical protein